MGNEIHQQASSNKVNRDRESISMRDKRSECEHESWFREMLFVPNGDRV